MYIGRNYKTNIFYIFLYMKYVLMDFKFLKGYYVKIICIFLYVKYDLPSLGCTHSLIRLKRNRKIYQSPACFQWRQ